MTKTIRHKIVEAARKRFTHYGYSKTTMAEVASDCNMSPGNLYRYFPGKLDIAEEIGRETSAELRRQVAEAVAAAGPGAAAKLRAYFISMLELTFGQVQYNEKVHEIVLLMRSERPEHWHRYMEEDRLAISRLLQEGVASGEFSVADPAWTAEVLYAAVFKFRYSQLIDDTPLDQLRRELNALLDMLLCALTAGLGDRTAAAGGRSGASLSQSNISEMM